MVLYIYFCKFKCKIPLFSAGYSEDSDYTSDVNFPVNGQFPNAATSQYLQVTIIQFFLEIFGWKRFKEFLWASFMVPNTSEKKLEKTWKKAELKRFAPSEGTRCKSKIVSLTSSDTSQILKWQKEAICITVNNGGTMHIFTSFIYFSATFLTRLMSCINR